MNNPLVTEEQITAIKNAGFKCIRIPITWEGHFDAYHKSYKINKAFLKRLDDVISMCLKQDLYVCINMQNDSWRWFCRMKKKNDTYYKMFTKLWTQIAKHYKGYSNHLVFEAIDKPYFEKLGTKAQQQLLNEVNKAFVKIVRKSGGKNKNRLLGVATLNSSVTKTGCKAISSNIKAMKDKRVFATVHYYGPWKFSVNAAGATTFTATVEKQVKNTVDMVYSNFYKEKIPVVCTEYGLLGYDSSYNGLIHGEVLKYIDYLTYYARKKKLPMIVWDNGNIFNRKELKFNDVELGALIINNGKVRSASADANAIYLRKKENCNDYSFSLKLNGNQLQMIADETKTLIENKDYECKGKQVILKSSYLKKMNRKKCAKVNTIVLSFDQGQALQIPIYVTEQPVLASSKGTEENGITIPMTCSTEKLIKMSAVYEKKKTVIKKVKKKKVKTQVTRYAGPLTYTPYQEYGYSFYQNKDKIVLTSDFLTSLKDEKIHLVFYFESGNVATYDIIKEKEKVQEVNYVEPVVTKKPQPSSKAKSSEAMSKEVRKNKSEIKHNMILSKGELVVILSIGFLLLMGVLYYLYHEKNQTKE